MKPALMVCVALAATILAMALLFRSGRGVSPAGSTRTRDVYSITPASDPYVLDQQRKVIEALERECERAATHCAEAKAARSWAMEQNRPSLVH